MSFMQPRLNKTKLVYYLAQTSDIDGHAERRKSVKV